MQIIKEYVLNLQNIIINETLIVEYTWKLFIGATSWCVNSTPLCKGNLENISINKPPDFKKN
jgi:hypothetical protein